MKELKKFGSTSNMVRVFIRDSSVTTGVGLSTVTYSSSGLVIDVIADNAASGGVYHYKSAATATIQDIGTAGSTCGTYAAPSAANCRFAPVDTTNFPGLYELQFLDGLFDDSGCTKLIGRVAGVANMEPTFFEIQLTKFDPQDAVRLGATALPNANADAAGGLPISDAGGLDLDALNAAVSAIQTLATTIANKIRGLVIQYGVVTEEFSSTTSLYVENTALAPVGSILVCENASFVVVRKVSAINEINAAYEFEDPLPDNPVDGDRVWLLPEAPQLASLVGFLTDARGEPGGGALNVSEDPLTKLDFLYKFLRNKKTQDADRFTLYDDAGLLSDQIADVSDVDGTTTVDKLVGG